MNTAKQLRLLNFAQRALWATAPAYPAVKDAHRSRGSHSPPWATWLETVRPT